MFNILPRQVTSTFSWCNDHKVLPIMQKCMNEPLTKRKPLIFVEAPLYSSAGNSPELIHTYLGPWIEKCAKNCASSQEIWRPSITSPTGID